VLIVSCQIAGLDNTYMLTFENRNPNKQLHYVDLHLSTDAANGWDNLRLASDMQLNLAHKVMQPGVVIVSAPAQRATALPAQCCDLSRMCYLLAHSILVCLCRSVVQKPHEVLKWYWSYRTTGRDGEVVDCTTPVSQITPQQVTHEITMAALNAAAQS
jgi:hypothetical protein